MVVPIEKEETIENKPVIELLSMIRTAYDSSHTFEKDGRHTVISFSPVDEDTYRVSLYSIKDNEEDLLMDAFFEQYQITDKLLEDLCNIYKEGTVIVASKIDNIPPDKAATGYETNGFAFAPINFVIFSLSTKIAKAPAIKKAGIIPDIRCSPINLPTSEKPGHRKSRPILDIKL